MKFSFTNNIMHHALFLAVVTVLVMLVVGPKCAEEECMLLIVVGQLGAMNLAIVLIV